MTGVFKDVVQRPRKANELCESSWLQRDSKDSQMVVPVKDGWELVDFDNGDLKNLFQQFHDLRQSKQRNDTNVVNNHGSSSAEMHVATLEEFEQKLNT